MQIDKVLDEVRLDEVNRYFQEDATEKKMEKQMMMGGMGGMGGGMGGEYLRS